MIEVAKLKRWQKASLVLAILFVVCICVSLWVAPTHSDAMFIVTDKWNETKTSGKMIGGGGSVEPHFKNVTAQTYYLLLNDSKRCQIVDQSYTAGLKFYNLVEVGTKIKVLYEPDWTWIFIQIDDEWWPLEAYEVYLETSGWFPPW